MVTWVLALGGVMSNAGCSGQACSGPGSFLFDVLFYGGPIVAAVTIIVSFFIVRHRWGIAAPLCALALLAADVVVLAVSF